MVHNEKENSYGYIDFGTKNLILSDKTEIKKVCDREVSGITEYLFNEYKIQIEEVGRGISAPDDIDKYDKLLNIEDQDHEFNRCFLITVQHLGELQTVFLSAPYYTTDSFVAPHPNGLLFVMNEIIGVFDPRTLGTQGLYTLANAGVGDVLKVVKNGNFWGHLSRRKVAQSLRSVGM